MIKSKTDYKSISLIIENLEKLYSDGIGIILAFELILELDLKKEYKKSLLDIKKNLEMGNSLGESFEKHKKLYPEFFINILKVGEETGKLSYVLKGLSKYYKNTYEYRNKIRKSLIYPSITLIFLILILIGSLYLIIPTFNEIIMEKEALPTITKQILSLSIFLSTNKFIGFIYISIILIVFPGVIILLKGERIKDIFLKKTKIYNMKNEYEILLILNLFIQSGINIPNGIEFFNKNREDDLKNSLDTIKKEILLGKSLVSSLIKSNQISQYSIAMVKIGEESGNIESRLTVILNNLENEREEKIKTLMTFIQPTLMIILTGGVISFMTLFLFPIIDTIYGGGF